jgi:hypothetical protein
MKGKKEEKTQRNLENEHITKRKDFSMIRQSKENKRGKNDRGKIIFWCNKEAHIFSLLCQKKIKEDKTMEER